MRVVSLHIYPVKGMRACNVERAQLVARGFAGDRRWVVVDATGKFITQRSHPHLATITVRPSAMGLVLSAPGADDLSVRTPAGRERIDVVVWADRVNAALADEPAHAWLSKVLGERLMLAHMDERADRQKTGIWVTEPIPLSFADAFPVLIATTGSLAALNAEIVRRGGVPIAMTRFRPNLVVECNEPWRDDFWKVLRIGGVELELMKPSDRCIVTTTDQATGERMGEEPLESLRRLRLSGDKRIAGVLFGWNAAPRALGTVAVGDAVEVVETRPEGFPIRRAGLASEVAI
jgi:uncharacterized protein YcbX